MTIQDTIIEALKASQAAHSRGLATIAGLRADKVGLEAEVVRLNAQVAHLRSHVERLQDEARKIVEPASVQPLLSSLMRAVEETHQATSASPDGEAPLASREPEPLPEEPHYDEPVPPPSIRPMLRQILDRDYSAQDVAEAAR